MTVYTLFGQSGGSAIVNDTAQYTMAMEFKLSQNAALTGIWFYSASGANGLPTACCLYDVLSQTQIAGTINTSPSWSGAAGSGWIKCTYAGSVTLNANQRYKVAILKPGGVSQVYSAYGHYWDGAGPGTNGLTNGIITAPNNASGDFGQDSFSTPSSAGLTYPTGAFNASNYWLDVEVSTGGVSHTATAALTVTPSFSAARVRGKYRAAALTVSSSFSAARTRGKYRTASLAVVPAFGTARRAAHVRSGSLLVTPSFLAVRSGGAAPPLQAGSWWGLDTVFKQSRQEFEAYVSRPPAACPVCGEPLTNAPATMAGSGVELYCRFGGDHTFRYPGDWIPPSRPDF